MNNKSVVIIGSTCELGIELSKIYAKNKYDLILIARDEKKNQDLKKSIKYEFSQTEITCLQLDILNTERQYKIIEEMKQIPDGVISLVGETHNLQGIIEKNFFKIVNVNFTYLANFLTIFLEKFDARNFGFLICVSSVAGLRGRAKNFIYGSAKAALNTFLSGCRNYYAKKNILIMTVLPGFIGGQTSNKNKSKTNNLLSIKPSKLAERIYNSQQKRKEIVYSSFIWFFIMIVIRLLPNKIFKKINF